MSSNVPPKPQEVKIGNYALEKTVGNGKFGCVKKGRHVLTGHPVAVKIMNRRLYTGCEIVEKVQREIVVLFNLQHPHIIKLYQSITTPTYLCMVLEFINGGDLQDYINNNPPLTEYQARNFFQQIISGVSYCHSHHIIHRDLKLENILLDNMKNVKIADFGLSNILKEGELMKTSCGSPNYASPEIISGCAYIGPEVDVWSCGVILYALLTSQLPFDEPNLNRLFQKIKDGIFPMSSFIPVLCYNLIYGMLNVHTAHRYTIQKITEDTWFRIGLKEHIFCEFSSFLDELDDTILEKIVEIFQVSKEMIVKALKSRKYHDPLVGAYRLYYDEKYKNETAVSRNTSPQQGFRVHVRDHEEIEAREDKPKNKFTYGYKVSGDPIKIMNQIYLTLQQLKFEWKTKRPFEIEARKPSNDHHFHLGIHLYQKKDDAYIVDFYTIPTYGHESNNDIIHVNQEKDELSIITDRYDEIDKRHGMFNSIGFLDTCLEIIKRLTFQKY